MPTTQKIDTTPRLPDVQYQQVFGKGTHELWTALALASGFPDDLSNDNTWLLGLCIAECLAAFTDDNLPEIIREFSEDQKADLRRRASRRACGQAYPRAG